LASPLQDISLNVQSPRVDQSPSFSFQFWSNHVVVVHEDM
jgi:hypothetical protein